MIREAAGYRVQDRLWPNDHFMEYQGQYFIIPGTRGWNDQDPRPEALRKIKAGLDEIRNTLRTVGTSPQLEVEITFLQLEKQSIMAELNCEKKEIQIVMVTIAAVIVVLISSIFIPRN